MTDRKAIEIVGRALREHWNTISNKKKYLIHSKVIVNLNKHGKKYYGYCLYMKIVYKGEKIERYL